MARGRPAAWSGLFALPIVATGVYVAALQSQFSSLGPSTSAPPVAGLGLVVFGLFVFGLGVYVEYVAAPEAPTLRPGERIVDERDPAQRNALGQAVVALPVLGAGIYLLYFTELPYVYPIVGFALGLYLFSTGCYRYWRNTLTSYILTNRRVLEEYRFISLVRNEVPHEKVRSVEERRSFWDSLFGLGSVFVRAGAAGDLTVTVADVYDPTLFADEIRAQLDDYDVAVEDDEDDDGGDGTASGDAGDDSPGDAVAAVNDEVVAGAAGTDHVANATNDDGFADDRGRDEPEADATAHRGGAGTRSSG